MLVKIDSSLTFDSHARILRLVKELLCIASTDPLTSSLDARDDGLTVVDHDYNNMLATVWHVVVAQFGTSTFKVRSQYTISCLSSIVESTGEWKLVSTQKSDCICVCSRVIKLAATACHAITGNAILVGCCCSHILGPADKKKMLNHFNFYKNNMRDNYYSQCTTCCVVSGRRGPKRCSSDGHETFKTLAAGTQWLSAD
jgi:hypothetical protein